MSMSCLRGDAHCPIHADDMGAANVLYAGQEGEGNAQAVSRHRGLMSRAGGRSVIGG